MAACARCLDHAWVCEAHTDRPWCDDVDPNSTCHAPGMPCPDCNPSSGPDDPPRYPPGHIEIWHRDKGTVH